MTYPLRCQCGAVQGELASPHAASRALCYCRDCQAFARFLGADGRALDAQGGTDIVATLPRHVRFTQGQQHLQCMSLSDKGLLRWYAGCCRTPIGNTPRDPRMSYVGLVRTFLAGAPAEIDQRFGPARVALNTDGARGRVQTTRIATFVAVLKIMKNVLGARLGGGYRQNPFFRAGTSQPMVAPQVVSAAEHRALRGDA